VVGIVSEEAPRSSSGWPYLGRPEMLEAVLDGGEWSEVVNCLGSRERPLLERVVEASARRGIPMSISIPLTDEDDVPSVARTRRSEQMRIKRMMDVAGAAVALTVSAPILALVALAILVADGRPVFFRQARAGQYGRPFQIVKFRTMHRQADALRSSLRPMNELSGQAAFKLTNDPRTTRLGRWLRRMSLDEVPQLWNVLRGDMSLVGPRPHPFDDVAGYEPWHLQRLLVKPGLTGLWQVELRGDPDFDHGVRADLAYIARWSLPLDLKVIFKTVPAVVRGTGR
jgi:lipopolysaccharide/colanic/teichoic acid biosynthesis glycosyltransferase